MKLYKYITENKSEGISNDRDEIEYILKKECSQYLKETNGKNFYKGINNITTKIGELGYKNIRTDRRPRAMYLSVFKKFNKWLSNNGHCDRSKSTSASSNKDFVKEYFGKPYIIYIKGKYDYTWVKTKDINLTPSVGSKNNWYNDIVSNYFSITNSIEGPLFMLKKMIAKKKEASNMFNNTNDYFKYLSKIEKEYIIEVRKWLDKEFPNFFVSNKGMMEAHKQKYEIWFKAKGFYYIDEDFEEKLGVYKI